MTAPKVYKSTDPNAPVACATPQSLINILDACLVDGYGDLPGAGWTKPFASADGTGAVYKQGAGGNGMYLKIFGTAEMPQGFSYSYLGRGCHGAVLFENMTDYNNGVGRAPAGVNFVNEMCPVSSRLYQSNSENTAPCAWMVIADSAVCYFFCWHKAGSSVAPAKEDFFLLFSAGTFLPLNSDESSCSFIGVMFTATSSEAFRLFRDKNHNKMGSFPLNTGNQKVIPTNYPDGQMDPAGGDANIFVSRPASGAQAAAPARLGWGGGPQDMAYDESKPLLVSRPYLMDGAPVQNLRGWLPGLYTSNYHFPFDNWTVIEDGGQKFISVSGKDNHFLFDLSDNFRPA